MEDYIGIIIIGAVAVIFIVFMILRSKKFADDELEEFVSKLEELQYTVTPVKNQPYNFIAKNNKITFYIRMFPVPSYSEVAINAKTTFEIKYGAGKNPGVPQKYHKLINMSGFMNIETKQNEMKVVVVTPTPKQIVMWINENEIKFVKNNTNVYGARVISDKDFEIFKQNKEEMPK